MLECKEKMEERWDLAIQSNLIGNLVSKFLNNEKPKFKNKLNIKVFSSVILIINFKLSCFLFYKQKFYLHKKKNGEQKSSKSFQ